MKDELHDLHKQLIESFEFNRIIEEWFNDHTKKFNILTNDTLSKEHLLKMARGCAATFIVAMVNQKEFGDELFKTLKDIKNLN